MQLTILGAHQGESRDTRFISLLVDGRLAIDAGGLTTSLSLDEQFRIEAVLLTHRHYDHIKDLPMLAHAVWESKSLQVYCTRDTREALQAHLLNGVIWPAMREQSGIYHPVVFHDVEPGKPFQVLDYEVLPEPVLHSVPAVGYLVSKGGRALFYAADSRADGVPSWAELRPDLLLIESTMSSEEDEAAARFKHLTPLSLEKELRAFHDRQGYYPRTIVVHLNPKHEARIKEEVARLAEVLGADIRTAHEGMAVDV